MLVPFLPGNATVGGWGLIEEEEDRRVLSMVFSIFENSSASSYSREECHASGKFVLLTTFASGSNYPLHSVAI